MCDQRDSISVEAIELGLRPDMLSRWKREYSKDETKAFNSKGTYGSQRIAKELNSKGILTSKKRGTKDKDFISVENFDNCLELTSIDKKLQVKSYSIAFLRVRNGKTDTVYADYLVAGSKAAKDALVAIKKYQHKKFLLKMLLRLKELLKQNTPVWFCM